MKISNNSKVWSDTGQSAGDLNQPPCGEVRGCEHASIFENALRYLLRGIDSHHRRTLFSALHRAPVFPLRCCGDCDCAIRGFCEADSAARATATYRQGNVALQKGIWFPPARISRKKLCGGTKESEGHNSGLGLVAQGEIDSANRHFRSAVKLSPDLCAAHMNFSSR